MKTYKTSAGPKKMPITVQSLILAGLFLALGLILPFLTGQIPQLGNKLLPMHIPVILCGYICGPRLGFLVGAITPLLRSMLFSIPPLFPTALSMSFELAAYGLVAGILYSILGRKVPAVYISLIIAMIIGRLVWGGATYLLLGLSGTVFTWQLFTAGAFLNAIPGIIIQLILIPVIVIAAERQRQRI